MIILTCNGYEYEFPPWVSTTVMHRNHKIEIFRYVYLTWNIETSTNIVPVLGAIQADLTYRVYNIRRSNWMFKHPWDSWNRMQVKSIRLRGFQIKVGSYLPNLKSRNIKRKRQHLSWGGGQYVDQTLKTLKIKH